MSKKNHTSVGSTHQLEALQSMDPCVRRIHAVSSPVSAALVSTDASGNARIGDTYATGACFIVSRRGYPSYQLVLMGDRDVCVGVQSTWQLESVTSLVSHKIIVKVPTPLGPVEADSYCADTFTSANTTIAFSFPSQEDHAAFLAQLTGFRDKVSSAHSVIKEGISRDADASDSHSSSSASATAAGGFPASASKAGKGKQASGKPGKSSSIASLAPTTPSLSPSPSGGDTSTSTAPASSPRRQPTILPKPSSRSSVHAAARALAEASRALSAELARATSSGSGAGAGGNGAAAAPPQALVLQAQVIKAQVEALVLEAGRWEAEDPSAATAASNTPTVGAGAGGRPGSAATSIGSGSVPAAASAGTEALIDAAASSLAAGAGC